MKTDRGEAGRVGMLRRDAAMPRRSLCAVRNQSEQSILIPALPSCASCPMRARIEILGDANPVREGGCQPPRMRRRRPSSLTRPLARLLAH